MHTRHNPLSRPASATQLEAIRDLIARTGATVAKGSHALTRGDADRLIRWLHSQLEDRRHTPIPGARHGTRSAYVQGCRCPACRRANNDYMRRRRSSKPDG